MGDCMGKVQEQQPKEVHENQSETDSSAQTIDEPEATAIPMEEVQEEIVIEKNVRKEVSSVTLYLFISSKLLLLNRSIYYVVVSESDFRTGWFHRSMSRRV